MADPGASAPSEGRARILTTLLLLPGLGLLWLGGWPAAVLVLLAGAFMLSEALGVAGIEPASGRGGAIMALGLGPALLGCLGEALPLHPWFHPGAYWLVAGGAAAGLAALGRSWATSALLVAVMLALAGGVGLALHGDGTPWLLVVAVVVAAADIAAFLVGKRVGGPKLAPSASPSKTWSGALAGLAGGCLAGLALGEALALPPLAMAVAGLVIADLSIGGDLLESIFKRAHGVKDAGSALPGHGGLLDRFDGYLLALPAAWLAVHLGWLHGGAHG